MHHKAWAAGTKELRNGLQGSFNSESFPLPDDFKLDSGPFDENDNGFTYCISVLFMQGKTGRMGLL